MADFPKLKPFCTIARMAGLVEKQRKLLGTHGFVLEYISELKEKQCGENSILSMVSIENAEQAVHWRINHTARETLIKFIHENILETPPSRYTSTQFNALVQLAEKLILCKQDLTRVMDILSEDPVVPPLTE